MFSWHFVVWCHELGFRDLTVGSKTWQPPSGKTHHQSLTLKAQDANRSAPRQKTLSVVLNDVHGISKQFPTNTLSIKLLFHRTLLNRAHQLCHPKFMHPAKGNPHHYNVALNRPKSIDLICTYHGNIVENSVWKFFLFCQLTTQSLKWTTCSHRTVTLLW